MAETTQYGNDGERAAARHDDGLVGIYLELTRVAARYMSRERCGHLLEPRALVHEAFVKVLAGGVSWRNRSHLVGSMAHRMRHILVDDARRRRSRKRTAPVGSGSRARIPVFEDLLAARELLAALAAASPARADIVIKRIYSGMTFAEIASETGMCEATVKLEWDFSRAWLLRAFKGRAASAALQRT